MSQKFQQSMIAGAADGSTRAYIGITKQLSLRLRFPSVARQKTIAAKLDLLMPETQRLTNIYERKLTELNALKESLLHSAFSGKLMSEECGLGQDGRMNKAEIRAEQIPASKPRVWASSTARRNISKLRSGKRPTPH
jgi:hypothetical protein